MAVMPPDKEAVVRYGRELRTLRDETGMTQTALARATNTSKSTISAVERGLTAPTTRLREALDSALGTEHLARVWEELTGDGREAWKAEVAELVDTSSAVYEYLVLVWPAHLQTEQYAQALIRHGAQWLTDDEVAAQASNRAKRATRLTESPRPKLWIVMDEALLYRRYGSTETTRDQLASVIDLVERDRITVQLLPMNAAKHPGTSGAFKLITTETLPDVLFAESAREGQLVTNSAEVTNWRMQFAALQSSAIGPSETLAMMKAELRKMDHE
ncbi:helix-turn-helix domain-containing protein [Nocardiopsis suaedae]|uniref:Helix-turn-helix transcriptional regulator n=1 Tax=Nocardiopsis suaedae TaxID=3018444 RepID=A0ABT4TTK3_9ACTN|nr:helix-turn-helix transcriptional regulator [Nocardiopsis suaedae]MDA2808003.1 helix-turn-helix transcriptional regulator [Nocardiopsis suaedae]